MIYGLDIETNGLDYRDAATFKIWMVGLDDGVRVVISNGHAAWLRQVATVVGHNAIAFDQPALEARYGPFPFTFDDSMLLCYLADESAYHYDLSTCAQRYLGVPPWKDDVTWDWANFDTISEDEKNRAYQYNARDARYTRRLYTTLQQRLSDKQWNLYEKLLKPAARALEQIHRNGVPISRENLKEATEATAIRIEQSRDALCKAAETIDLGKKKFNPNSHPHIRKLLFEHLGFEPIRKTDGGAPSTDEATIHALRLLHADSILESLLTYRETTKLQSTYLRPYDKFLEQDGRVHPSYSLIATVSGRTSARNPNIQQLPRDESIRRIVAARPGYKLIVADLSQMEMRTMAFLSREPNLLAVYQQNMFGGDAHAVMADRIAKIRGESTFTKEDRTLAKPINFGCLYGAEPYTLQATTLKNYGIRLTYEQAEFLRDDVFFEMFSKLPVYYDAIHTELRNTNKVTSPLGRERTLANIHAHDTELRAAALREGINTPNQGLASDLALMATIDCVAAYPTWVVAFIHDAILLEVPREVAESTANDVKTKMEMSPRVALLRDFGIEFDVPISCDVTICEEWK